MAATPFPSTLSIPISSKEKNNSCLSTLHSPSLPQMATGWHYWSLLNWIPRGLQFHRRLFCSVVSQPWEAQAQRGGHLQRNLVPSPSFPSSYTKGSFTQEAVLSDWFLTTAAGSCTVACCFWLLTWNHSSWEFAISFILPAWNRNTPPQRLGFGEAGIWGLSRLSVNTSLCYTVIWKSEHWRLWCHHLPVKERQAEWESFQGRTKEQPAH